MKNSPAMNVILSVVLFGATVVAQPSFTPKADFASNNNPSSIAAGDLNGDGKPDLVVTHEGDSSISVFLNTAPVGASIPAFTTRTDFANDSRSYSVALGDLNGDGKPDLAVTDFDSDSVSIYLNTTVMGSLTPSFTAGRDFGTGSGAYAVFISDLSGDGKPDVAVTNMHAGTISVLSNTTASGALIPSFMAKTDLTTGMHPYSVSIGDLNGDGKPDMAVANFSSNTVSVLLNTTTFGAAIPTFAAKTDFTTGLKPRSVTIEDLNGDGNPDLAVANSQPFTVSVLLNATPLGATTPAFTAKTDFTTGNNPTSVSSGDFNGDGKPDLAVADLFFGSVSVLRNATVPGSSTPSFNAKVDVTTGNGPISVSIGDFNGDTRPDLATANYDAHSVSVLLNASPTSQSEACITWGLSSSDSVTSLSGNIGGQPEMIGTGSTSPLMSIFGYSNGQELWVGTNGWVAGPLDTMRFVEFNASAQSGNSFTVTNVSFDYGDFPLSTDFNMLAFQAYYSVDNWTSSTVLNSTALVYLNTSMSAFSQSISVYVPSGQTFSLRIFPYALQNGMAMIRTYAIHKNVNICGTTAPEVVRTGSICGVKFNDLNGNGVLDAGEPGLPDWQIGLEGMAVPFATTNKDGVYCFNDVPAGDYRLAEVNQSGWVQTFPSSPGTHTVSLLAGQSIEGLNFGNRQVVECVTPPDSMAAWWPLDESSLTKDGSISNDLAGTNNVGTRVGGPVPVAGRVSGGLQFDGTNDYVEVPDQSELNFGRGNFSFDAWIQTTDSVGAGNLVDKRSSASGYVGYSFFLNDGRLSLQLATGAFTSYTSPVFVADGAWHHIAVTVSRTSVTGILFYLDGVATQFGNPTTHAGSLDHTGPLRIGSQSFATGYLFSGILDEIELFNRVLTQQEIVSIFAAGAAGKCKPASTIGSLNGFKFNDVNGNGARDPGEHGLSGWVINLNAITIPADTTDQDGYFSFNDIPAGTYTVSETMQSGWIQTAPAGGHYTVTLAGGQTIDSLMFGNMADPCKSGSKAWSPLGTGLSNGTNGEVWALAVIGSDLYAGGTFTTAGGNTANHVAKWNGTSWSPLISNNTGVNGVNGMVTALNVIGSDLYVGGWFTDAGGVVAENIAKWDGTNWSALGSGIQAAGAINALAVMGNDLFATSYILTPALGGPGHLIVKWDGATWSTFSVMDDYVSSFWVDGTDLYAGGQFSMIGGVSASKIAKWDGANWSRLGTVADNGTNFFIGGTGMMMMAGNLYSGGRFTVAGGNTANYIAKWDGTIWSSFGTGINNGMNNSVEGFAVIGQDLYASGSFTTAEGVLANSVAKWDGTTWTPLGTGMNDGVWRLAVIGSDLYAAGVFTTAGGLNANYIAKYSCSSTTPVDEADAGDVIPQQFRLKQNFPNPFNPGTNVGFDVPVASSVRIVIYDVLGRYLLTLVDETFAPGSYQKYWNASGLPSGVYFCQMEAGSFKESTRLFLLK